VWALESICHARDKAAFYREAMRLLRPGGRLVIADYIRSGRDNAANDEKIVREWLDGWAIPDVATRAEHVGYATAAGFSNVELTDFTRVTKPSLRRLHRLAVLAGPIETALYKLGLRTPTQHGNVVASRRQFEALERGLWFYGVLTAAKS
jgi:SAM-dependent methyltransferase